MAGWMDRWMDGWMDMRMDGWMDKRVDGWIDGQINIALPDVMGYMTLLLGVRAEHDLLTRGIIYSHLMVTPCSLCPDRSRYVTTFDLMSHTAYPVNKGHCKYCAVNLSGRLRRH